MSVQDAPYCMTIQAGMAFRKCPAHVGAPCGPMYLCVANLRWAVLGWPLVPPRDDDDTKQILDPNGGLSWHFAYRAEDYEAALIVPVFQGEVGIAGEITEWQPSLQLFIERFTDHVVFRDLEFLAVNLF